MTDSEASYHDRTLPTSTRLNYYHVPIEEEKQLFSSNISLDSSHQELQFNNSSNTNNNTNNSNTSNNESIAAKTGSSSIEFSTPSKSDSSSSSKINTRTPPRFNSMGSTNTSGSTVGNNFQTVVRIRPTSKSSILEDASSCIIDLGEDMKTMTVGKSGGKAFSDKFPSYHFTFDRVYDEYCSQQLLYQSCCAPLVRAAMKGINSTVFSYGQTRAGKSYTFEGIYDNDRKGLIIRAMEDLFSQIRANTTDGPFGCYYVVKASFVQIYNEVISDLLVSNSHNLKITEDKHKGISVNGAKQHTLKDASDIITVIRTGKNNRGIASGVKLPDLNSRSHTILTISVEQLRPNPPKSPKPDSFKYSRADMVSVLMRSRMNFVELAGSERARDFSNLSLTSVKNDDGVKIAKAFNSLSTVIAFLSRSGKHTPYRETKLTHILKESLNLSSLCLFITNIYPLGENYNETLSALKYASRIRQSSGLLFNSGQSNSLESESEPIVLSPYKRKYVSFSEDEVRPDDDRRSGIENTNISAILENSSDKNTSSSFDTDEELKNELFRSERDSLVQELLHQNSGVLPTAVQNLLEDSTRLEMELSAKNHLVRQQQIENEDLNSQISELRDVQQELHLQNEELKFQVDQLSAQNTAAINQIKELSAMVVQNAVSSKSSSDAGSVPNSPKYTTYTTTYDTPEELTIVQTTETVESSQLLQRAQDYDRLVERLDVEHQDSLKLQQELEAARGQITEQQTQMKRQQSQHQTQVSELEDEIKLLKQQMLKQQQQYEAQLLQGDQETQRLQLKQQQYRSEISQLEQDIQTQQQKYQRQISEFEQEIEKQQHHYEFRISQLEADAERQQLQLKKQQQQFESQISKRDYESQLQQQTQQLQLRTEISHLEQEIQKQQQQYPGQISELEAEIQRLQQQTLLQQQQYESQLLQFNQETQRLHQKQQHYRSEISQLEQELQRQQQKQVQMTQLEENVERLQQQIVNQRQAYEAQISELEAQQQLPKPNSDQKYQYQSDIAQLEQAMHNRQQRYQTQINQLEKETHSLELETQRLRKELSDSRRDLSFQSLEQPVTPSKPIDTREQNSSYVSKIVIYENELASRIEWLNSNQRYIKEYEEDVRDLTHEVEMLRKQLRVKDSTIREYITETQNLKLKVEYLETRKGQIEEDLETVKNNLEILNDKLRDTTKEKELVEGDLTRTRKELREVKDEGSEQAAQLRAIKHERDNLHLKIQSLSSDINISVSEKDTLASELAESKEALKAITSQYEQCKQRLYQAEGDLVQSSMNHSVLQNEMLRVEKELHNVKQDYAEFKNTANDRKRFLTSEIDRLRDELSTLREQLQIKNAEISLTTEETKRLRMALRECEIELERVREAYEKTNKDLKDIITTFSSL